MKKIVVIFDKKSVKSGLLTEANLRKVVGYTGDKTWNEDDFEDTIEKFNRGNIVGITYMSYKTLRENDLSYLSYFSSDKKGEFVDIPKNSEVTELVKRIAKEKEYKIYTLKDILKKIEK